MHKASSVVELKDCHLLRSEHVFTHFYFIPGIERMQILGTQIDMDYSSEQYSQSTFDKEPLPTYFSIKIFLDPVNIFSKLNAYKAIGQRLFKGVSPHLLYIYFYASNYYSLINLHSYSLVCTPIK
jgi:hypothetical protein